jgi:hypothetical protein
MQAGLINSGSEATELVVSDTEASYTLEMPDTAVPADSAQQIVIELTAGSPVRAETSLLMNEHWDGILPYDSNGRSAYGAYFTEVTGGQRPITNPDSPEKREEMVIWLEEADYIVLSSQRAVWSLPRLPLTYPMTTRYFEALFSGELGFELVAEFHAPLQIGPLYISDTTGQVGWGEMPEIGWPPPGDLAAEEAFSVYDHPPVWIFAKTESYSRENTVAILGEVDLGTAVFTNPGQATEAPNGLLLSETAAATQRANGTFSDIFNPDGILSQNSGLAAVVWWLAVIALGLVTFPLTFAVFRGLPSRGYIISRIFSILLISYFVWLTASMELFHNSRGTHLLALLLIVILSALVLIRRGGEIRAWVRHNLAFIGVVELIAVGLYFVAILIRVRNPDVWDVIWGGEKPMDLTYFTAVLKSATFPPYDPWFAGGYINYYYYGFVYAGVLTKLLGIVPTIAYNLNLSMLFSFTGMAVFSVAYDLVAARDKVTRREGDKVTRRQGDRVTLPADVTLSPRHPVTPSPLHHVAVYAGLIAATLAILLGNLGQVGVLTDAWYKAGNPTLEETIPLVGTAVRTLDGGFKVMSGTPAPIYPGDWFWTATRLLNYNEGEAGPITEFPFFTFLYGDLHAHMIALPLTMLALAWAVSLVLKARDWRLEIRDLEAPLISNLQSRSRRLPISTSWWGNGAHLVQRGAGDWRLAGHEHLGFAHIRRHWGAGGDLCDGGAKRPYLQPATFGADWAKNGRAHRPGPAALLALLQQLWCGLQLDCVLGWLHQLPEQLPGHLWPLFLFCAHPPGPRIPRLDPHLDRRRLASLGTGGSAAAAGAGPLHHHPPDFVPHGLLDCPGGADADHRRRTAGFAARFARRPPCGAHFDCFGAGHYPVCGIFCGGKHDWAHEHRLQVLHAGVAAAERGGGRNGRLGLARHSKERNNPPGVAGGARCAGGGGSAVPHPGDQGQVGRAPDARGSHHAGRHGLYALCQLHRNCGRHQRQRAAFV